MAPHTSAGKCDMPNCTSSAVGDFEIERGMAVRTRALCYQCRNELPTMARVAAVRPTTEEIEA